MENMSNCTVVEFETKESSLIESLGIPEERADFLTKRIMHAFIDEDRYSAMIARVSTHCKHPNELAFVGMTIGKIAALKSSKMKSDSILGMLGGE
jgi:hypothetical protein